MKKTPESIAERERLQQQRKLQPRFEQPTRRPSKRDRRLIHRFKQTQNDN